MRTTESIGKMTWNFCCGRIPLDSTGPEPEFTSHDQIAVLNTSGERADFSMTIFYEEEPPVGEYQFSVCSERVRKIRFNDLIDPYALELEKNYSCFLESNVPLVIQFLRMSTADRELATVSTMAF